MYVADHSIRQRRVTLHHSSRQAARPASYRHLYQIRRFNGDVIAQVLLLLLLFLFLVICYQILADDRLIYVIL